MNNFSGILLICCALSWTLLACPSAVPIEEGPEDTSGDVSEFDQRPDAEEDQDDDGLVTSDFDEGDESVVDLSQDDDPVQDPAADPLEPSDPQSEPDATEVSDGDFIGDLGEAEVPGDVMGDLSDPDDMSDMGSLTPCATSDDCTLAGETCGLFSDGEGGILQLCHTQIGTSEIGPCTDWDECQTGFCLGGGFCYWACVDNGDCPDDYECSVITFLGETDEEDIDVPGCVPPLRTCTSYIDCLPLETCQVFSDGDNPNQIIQYCDVVTGDLDSGAECVEDGDCKTNDCFEFADGSKRCIGPCDPTTQAGCSAGTHCYPDMIMVVFDQGTDEEWDDLYDSFATCLEYFGSYTPCESDADCALAPDDETCMITYDATRMGLEQYCVFPTGAGRGGATCGADGECRTDWCYEETYCFGVCDLDGEGSTECVGTTTCQTVEFVIDERDPYNDIDDITDEIDVCWP